MIKSGNFNPSLPGLARHNAVVYIIKMFLFLESMFEIRYLIFFLFFLLRSCLQLITDCPSVIQEELDLIRGLGYLEEFGVKILPLQGIVG